MFTSTMHAEANEGRASSPQHDFRRGKTLKWSDFLSIFVFLALVSNMVRQIITSTYTVLPTDGNHDHGTTHPQVEPQRILHPSASAIIQSPHNYSAMNSTMDVPSLQPRTWDPWPSDRPLCFDPGPKLRPARTDGEFFPLSSMAFDESRMFKRGLVFMKPMKVGGSTASGVNLRIAKNMAERLGMDFPICENNFDHAMGYMFQERDPTQSFLWTLLRDPTKRAVSGFWHFRVSREEIPPTQENFLKEMRDQTNYYLNAHVRKLSKIGSRENAAKDILREFNFIAITERFDESLVVLQTLLNLTVGDMLYVKSSKSNGSYDDGGHKGMCTYILPSNLTSEMREYIESDEWKERIKWDQALYQAANESLDRTIDTIIGRSNFERKLEFFRLAEGFVNERCAAKMKPPCTGPGPPVPPEETNCLFTDSGCAYECLDRAVEDLKMSTDSSLEI